jgi:hypothetical protein
MAGRTNKAGAQKSAKPRKAKVAEVVAEAPTPVVVAYKGFRHDLTCTGGTQPFQYAIGQTFEHSGAVKACSSGLHACEHPLDVFGYYGPVGDDGKPSRFCLVEASGEIARHGDDSKIAAARLHIKAELRIPELVTAAIKFVTALCKPSDTQHATGNQSASSATGYRSASSATGDRSASSATGHRSASSATGDRSASSATGHRSASSATGYRSASSATGNQSASSATGHRSASSATGNQSASSATGNQSASSATGHRSASSATGDRSASLSTGYASRSEITSASATKNLNACAIATGEHGMARAPMGCVLFLIHRDDRGNIIAHGSAKVGERGIKPDVWYSLSAAGEFIEVSP